jgi:ankyrin repeat protein
LSDSEHPIHDAIVAGELGAFRAQIEDVSEINAKLDARLVRYRVDREFTPLHMAILAANPSASMVRMEQKGDALELGRRKVALEMARLLIEKGADIHTTSQRGLTALHVAAVVGYVEFAEMLVSAGAKVHSKCDSGLTPLHYAGGREVAEFLMANGARITAGGFDGMEVESPLHTVRKREVAEFLIEKGANINNADGMNGTTPLHCMLMDRYVDVAKLLLEKGAHPNIPDHNGGTALHMAASYPDIKMVAVLLEYGANRKIKDYQGNTPLDLAKEQGLDDIVALLKNES